MIREILDAAIREVRHGIAVTFDRAPFRWPAICPKGHVKTSGSSIQATLLEVRGWFLCPKCDEPMVRVSIPAVADHHIARAAAYYTEQGQQP